MSEYVLEIEYESSVIIKMQGLCFQTKKIVNALHIFFENYHFLKIRIIHVKLTSALFKIMLCTKKNSCNIFIIIRNKIFFMNKTTL